MDFLRLTVCDQEDRKVEKKDFGKLEGQVITQTRISEDFKFEIKTLQNSKLSQVSH
jgi:hypothetical protein